METLPSGSVLAEIGSSRTDVDIARVATQEVINGLNEEDKQSDGGLAEATYLGNASDPEATASSPNRGLTSTADFLQHYVSDGNGQSFSSTYPTIYTTVNGSLYGHQNYDISSSSAGNTYTSLDEPATLSYSGPTIIIPAADGQSLNTQNIFTGITGEKLEVESSNRNNYEDKSEDSFSPSAAASSSPPSLSYATRVSPTTIQWLINNYETSEGVSLPRSTLYSHYQNHCLESRQEPVNAASFGKLIRSVFLGLRTRRIGTRGNSKYHYYGIRVKPSSNLNSLNDNLVPPVKKRCCNSENDDLTHVPQQEINENKYLSQYFDIPTALDISSFPRLIIAKELLPIDLTETDIDVFSSVYIKHCHQQLEFVQDCNFTGIKELVTEFWSLTSSSSKFVSDPNEQAKYSNMKQKFAVFLNLRPIRNFIRDADFALYQHIVNMVIPNVLRQVPNALTQLIRNFAKHMEDWMNTALLNHSSEIIAIKTSSVKLLSMTLKRYTGLNHLAQAARAVLQNPNQIHQMSSDLNKVDFSTVHDNASWVCGCESSVIKKLEMEFKTTLRNEADLGMWADWLESVVDNALNIHCGRSEFIKAARRFLLHWSFYSSMIIRDLTLRSAASFGSFHLIRLLYDEYMYYIVEKKVATYLNITPVSVAGILNKEDSEINLGLYPNKTESSTTTEKNGFIKEDDVYPLEN